MREGRATTSSPGFLSCCRQSAKCIVIACKRSGFAERGIQAGPDQACLVDEERCPPRIAPIVIQHPVLLSYCTMRPEIRKQIEGVPLLLGEGAQRVFGIHGDPEQPDALVLKFGNLLLKVIEFPRADPGKGEGEENQHDGGAPATGKAHRFSVLVGKLEAGSRLT